MDTEIALNAAEWLSTYSVFTAKRILERYKIHLTLDELLQVIKNPHTFYYTLMQMPLKNIFNGLLIQQINDYQVYVQKLFVDYLLSSEVARQVKTGSLLEVVEIEKENLMQLIEEFQSYKVIHNKLIAESQRFLIKLLDNWHKELAKKITNIQHHCQLANINISDATILHAINAVLFTLECNKDNYEEYIDWKTIAKEMQIDLTDELHALLLDVFAALRVMFTQNMQQSLADYLNQGNSLTTTLCDFREQFYNFILRIHEVMKSIPGYNFDLKQAELNRETLHFDRNLGAREE